MEVNRSVLIQENRQINIQLEQSGNRAMAQKGLTAIQAHILLYILDHSDRGISLTDIHREFGYSMAAMPLTKSCALCSKKTVSLWKRETVFVVFMILRKCCVPAGTGSR